MTLDTAIAAIAWALMFVVGLDLTGTDFRRVLTQPRAVLAGTLGPLLLLPLLAAGLLWTKQWPPPVTAGLILLTAGPAGALANLYAHLARANAALAVTLTALSCPIAVVVMPLLARWGFGFWLATDPTIAVPVGPMIGQLLFVLLLPVALGMTVRHCWPAWSTRRLGVTQRLALLGLLALIGLVLYDQAALLRVAWRDQVAAALAFTLLAMAAGWAVGWISGLEPRDRFTLLCEFAVRNLAIAVLVAVTVLGRTDFVAFAAVMLLVQIPLLLLAVALYRYWAERYPHWHPHRHPPRTEP